MKTTMLGQIRFCLFIYGRDNLTGYSFLFYFTLLLESLGEITMSEAIILYRGRGGVDPESLKPQTITANGVYTAPVTGTYQVTCVGGGGGGGGGCRNSMNSSQVFYGAGGTRGTLNSMNVNLNQGDQIALTIGAGGSAGSNNSSVVSYNSRGTNGTSGGATSFGSYVIGSGGAYGGYSWSWSIISNILMENRYWMTARGDNYRYFADLGADSISWLKIWDSIYTGVSTFNEPVMMFIIEVDNTNISRNTSIPVYVNRTLTCDSPGTSYFFNQANGSGYDMAQYWGTLKLHDICNKEIATPINSQKGAVYRYMWYIANNYSDACNKTKMFGNNFSRYMSLMGAYDSTNWHQVFDFGNITITSSTPVWWNNTSYNYSTRCYTSIQQGSWWYLNNNSVSTSGSRAYRGDGGASGQSGNAGFILIIPPQE